MAKKKNTDVISIEDILKRKKFFEEKKKETKKLYVKSLDACIVVEKPDKELLFDVNDMDDEAESDMYLVYECIKEPNLHSPEIQEAFKDKINNPMEIIYEIFEPLEVANISRELVKFSGFGGVEEVEELKK